MRVKFWVGQLVICGETPCWIEKFFKHDGAAWVRLDGDMYPAKYPVSKIRSLTAKEVGPEYVKRGAR